MATARDIIRDAFLLLNAFAPDEAIPAQDYEDGLKRLNLLIHSWRGKGVDFGHADYALDDTVRLPPEHHEGLGALLAERLQALYPQRPITAAVARMSREGWAAIKGAYSHTPEMSVDSGLIIRRGRLYT